MKIITFIVPLFLLCGCAIVVLDEDDAEAGHKAGVRGFSRSLENKIGDLFEDLNGDEKHDKTISLKIGEIYLTLLNRDYYACKYFYLFNGEGTIAEAGKMADRLIALADDRESPYATLNVEASEFYRGFSIHSNSTYRITIIDRKENMDQWENHVRIIDENTVVEPWRGGFSYTLYGPAEDNEQ